PLPHALGTDRHHATTSLVPTEIWREHVQRRRTQGAPLRALPFSQASWVDRDHPVSHRIEHREGRATRARGAEKTPVEGRIERQYAGPEPDHGLTLGVEAEVRLGARATDGKGCEQGDEAGPDHGDGYPRQAVA